MNKTNCPNCGAQIDIHAEKCAYCDTPYMFDDRRGTTLYANDKPICTVYESRPLSACSDPKSTKEYMELIDSLIKEKEELKRQMDHERIFADALRNLRTYGVSFDEFTKQEVSKRRK